MKKTQRVTFRTDPDSWIQFEVACKAVGEDASSILRHLCNAATKYITINKLEQWYPPKLVLAPPELQTMPGFLTYQDGPARVLVRIEDEESLIRSRVIANAAEERPVGKKAYDRKHHK